MGILARWPCLQPDFPVTTLRQFSRSVSALLVLTGRVTRRGLARWAGPGGRYRTGQRVFSTVIPWGTLLWVVFRQPLYRTEAVSLLAGDAVVVTKAGKPT
jgi:putative transposase